MKEVSLWKNVVSPSIVCLEATDALSARLCISQSELAQRLDVSQTHMSNLEHGRVSVSLRVLLRLAHFFKCSVDTLLGSVLQGHVVPEVNNDGYDIEDLALLLKVLKQKRVEVM